MRPAIERSMQAGYLTERCTVERRTGESTFDETTGTQTDVTVTVYDGPVLARPQYRSSEEEAGAATYLVARHDVVLPADAGVVRGDLLTITEARADPALLETRLLMLDVPVDAWLIARYCVAERFS